MGWEDRPYYRDRPSSPGGVFGWLLTGSAPIGTLFGIHIRVHASLIVLVVLTLLFPGALGGIYGSFSFLTALFLIVLLHEFGHCFGSRMVGGDARNILMTPLGGLAFVDAPRRPWATAWTVAAGPLVNVIICLLCIAVLLIGDGWGALAALRWNPWQFTLETFFAVNRLRIHSNFLWWTWWSFSTSYGLLLFNLLPIFPLDGGQLMQSLLWVKLGYRRSMLFSAVTGMIGAVLLAMLGIATRSLLLAFIAFSGFLTCYQIRLALLADGPIDYEDSVDYSASLRAGDSRKRKAKGWQLFGAAKSQQKFVHAQRKVQGKIDAILDKVRDHGMHSLNWFERRTLRQATENQRRKNMSR